MSTNTGLKDTATDHLEDSQKEMFDDIPNDEPGQPIYGDKEIKKILRKVDWRMMPILTYLYLVSYLDRGNMGNAAVAGMNEDLGLTGAQFNFALTVRASPNSKTQDVIDALGLFHHLRSL